MGNGAEEDAPLALVDVTAWLFERASQRMAAVIEQLESGDAGEGQEAQRAIRDLRQALWLLVDERTRVDRLRDRVAGLVRSDGGDGDGRGGRKLDLDAARDEIGRRLAGLRAASDGG